MTKVFEQEVLPVESKKISIAAVALLILISTWLIVSHLIIDNYFHLPLYTPYIKILNGLISVSIAWIAIYFLLKKNAAGFSKINGKLKIFESILNNIDDVVWSYDLKAARFEYMSPGVEKLRGYTAKEVMAQSLDKVLTKESYEYVLNNLPLWISIYENGDNTAGARAEIISQPCRDGSIIETEVIVSLLKNPDGKVSRMIGVTRNLRTRKKILEKLKESEFWIEESQRVAKIGSFIYDFKHGNWEGSSVLYHIFGIDDSYERDLERWFQIIHPDEVDEMSIYFNNIVTNKLSFDREYRIVCVNDGQVKWVHGRGEIVADANGNPVKMIGTIQDITERKHNEAMIIESENKYRTIIETSLNGFYITDLEGRFLEVNDAYCRMSGYSRGELLKMNLSELDYMNDGIESKSRLRKIIKFGADRFETKHMTKHGEMIAVDVSVIYNPHDEGLLFCFMNDITEKNKMLHELVLAKDEAERSNRVKSEFLAQMSHEIRSPMNVTLSFTNYIKEELGDSLPQHLVESFAAVDTATRRVIRTIDLILNMSEMQLGTYEPTWKSFDLVEEVFDNMCGEYEFYAKQKGLKLNFGSKVAVPKVYGDHYSVTQIFVNLIDNAIKYSNSGSIDINIEKDREKNINVTVQDHGIGMSEEFQKKIFEPFTQETQGYSRKFEGNGLGLALVKKYCDLNNADISVESEKGKGTKFTVTFHRLMKLNVAVD